MEEDQERVIIEEERKKLLKVEIYGIINTHKIYKGGILSGYNYNIDITNPHGIWK